MLLMTDSFFGRVREGGNINLTERDYSGGGEGQV